MAKRFTDTEKWKRPWFRTLAPQAKVAWFYILDNCDHAGIWPADFGLLSYQTGIQVTREQFEAWFSGKVIPFEGDKYFIPSFFEFQYATAREGFKAKQGALSVLVAYGLVNVDGTLRKTSEPSVSVPNTSEQSMDCPSTGISIGTGIGNERGGVGEKTIPPLRSDEVRDALAEWDATLKHFEIQRPIGPRDELAIARAVQSFGAEWVRLAFHGARKQTKGKTFDPKQFVSLAIYLDPKRIERLVNIGAGKESADGLDWAKVFAS